MKLSFCTSCMSRFHHLKRTLTPNLENMISFGNEIEWVIVDYNSQDGMNEGLRDYIRFTISGHLTYYRTTAFEHFNYSHAKNLAHILAASDYVMNLDADNFIDRAGIARILQVFEEHPDAFVKGFGGLVGLKRSHFLSLGGYDEDFQGWGYEEIDLMMRAKKLGLAYSHLDGLRNRIEHSDEERLANIDPALLKEFGAKDPAAIKQETSRRNWRRSKLRLRERKIRANEHRIFGRATVTKNFSDETFEAGYRPSEVFAVKLGK